jgi:hypothetical protein
VTAAVGKILVNEKEGGKIEEFIALASAALSLFL